MTSRKRSLSEMQYSRPPSKYIDDETYRTTVLCLPADVTEDEIDERLAREGEELGLLPADKSNGIEGIASSLSATTLASDPNNQSSILTQSTAPTSCSSSERRPVTKDSLAPDHSPTRSNTPSILSDYKEKRNSGFRNGIRKMTGFRKRRSGIITSSTLTSLNSERANSNAVDQLSIKSDMKSPASIKSSKSSWSSPPSATKSSYEAPVPVDNEAAARSMECKEMLGLLSRQLDEKTRFLVYQRSVLSSQRSAHQLVKQQKLEAQSRIIVEATQKNEKAVEDLESRQLEDEMKLVKEFEVEKRTVLVRLRHMEAYCQNPTPPPTPVDAITGRISLEKQLPERKVTDKDYHNLAQQYRERDAMDDLHASRINVLRGKQKKAVENFLTRKEREIDLLEDQHRSEIEKLNGEALKEESAVQSVLGSKRSKLESRWRLQALIARSKMEEITGLKYAPLQDVVAADEPS